MTYAPIQGECPVCHQDSANSSFKAGAASRDVEVAELREELTRARFQNTIVYGTSHPEIYKTNEDALREHVTLLRDALMFCQSKIAYMLRNGEWYNPELALDTAREALAATDPERKQNDN
jgi:hypothetical protein